VRKLGATARLTGRSGSGGPVTVRLEPCGSATARLVGPDGKPLDRYPAIGLLVAVITPGAPAGGLPGMDGPLFADEGAVSSLDPVNHTRDIQSDAQGRVSFPALIPRASYRVVDRSPRLGGAEPAIRKEFSVKPGEAVELGDILIANPRRRNSP
jgi:hypothetical protein